MASSLSRGARVLLVLSFLAFVLVGSYYAWVGPEPEPRADAAPLVVVEPAETATPELEPVRLPEPQTRPASSEVADAPGVIDAESPVSVTPAVEVVVETIPTPTSVGEPLPPEGVIEVLPNEAPEVLGTEVEAPEAGRPKTHRVREGETLSAIAAIHFGDSAAWPRILAANPGVDADRLAVGTELLIPTTNESDPDPPPASESPTVAPAATSPRVHVVATGETLTSIARALWGDGSLWQRLYEQNRALIGADPGALAVGMRLVVPESKSP